MGVIQYFYSGSVQSIRHRHNRGDAIAIIKVRTTCIHAAGARLTDQHVQSIVLHGEPTRI